MFLFLFLGLLFDFSLGETLTWNIQEKYGSISQSTIAEAILDAQNTFLESPDDIIILLINSGEYEIGGDGSYGGGEGGIGRGNVSYDGNVVGDCVIGGGEGGEGCIGGNDGNGGIGGNGGVERGTGSGGEIRRAQCLAAALLLLLHCPE